MTKVTRVPGVAIQQFQHSQETMGISAKTEDEKRNAQLVVCEYVDAWYPHLDDAGKVKEVNELLDILGIKGR